MIKTLVINIYIVT